MKSYRPECFDLIKSIKKIPFHYTHLRLDRILQENSDNIPIQTVIESFKYIPAFVTHLDLSYNELLFKTEKELTALINAIPLSITHLDLSGNGCIHPRREGHSEQPIKLIILLTALSSKQNLSILDLRNNKFDTTYFDKLDEASVHPMKPLQPFVDTLYLSSDEIICMSKTKLDRFAKILPIAQEVYFTDKQDQMITSNKINYLARQLVLADARRALKGLALLDKTADFPSDLTLEVMRQLLSKRDIDFCVERLKIPLYSAQFFSSLSPISDKQMDHTRWVHDNYLLRKELIYFFLFSQLALSIIALTTEERSTATIPIGLIVLFPIIQLISMVDEKFDLGVFKRLNCPVELGFCSIGGMSGNDICMRFPNESMGDELKVSCFFK